MLFSPSSLLVWKVNSLMYLKISFYVEHDIIVKIMTWLPVDPLIGAIPPVGVAGNVAGEDVIS